MALITFPMLRDVNIAALESAAEGWRAQARALDATDDSLRGGLAPLKATWTGRAASGAISKVEVLVRDLKYASPQALLIVRALNAAASRLRLIQDRLHQLIEDARKHGLVVTDDGIHLPAMTKAERDYDANVEARQRLSVASALLRERVTELVRAAELLDLQVADVLEKLGPYRYIEDDFKNDAKAVAELAGLGETSLPGRGTDPRHVARWWAGMSAEDKLLLCNAFPKHIGALDGVAAVDRDTANRIYLDEVLKTPHKNTQAMQRLHQILADANKQSPGQLLLMGFDEANDGQAIVAIGNPDKARHTAIFVPGLETDLSDMPGMLDRAGNLSNAADNMTPGVKGDVSVIAWLGYDAPELNLSVAGSERSRQGGAALDGFVNGLNASHDSNPSHVTAIGHSYGSTVVGEAAKTGDGLAVGDIVTAGSPGMHVSNASELQIGAQHVWAGAAPDDPVANPGSAAGGWFQSDAFLGTLSPALPYIWESSHGTSPHYDGFGANRFQVDTSGHSAYWQVGTQSLANQAAVIVGDYSAVKLDHGAAP